MVILGLTSNWAQRHVAELLQLLPKGITSVEMQSSACCIMSEIQFQTAAISNLEVKVVCVLHTHWKNVQQLSHVTNAFLRNMAFNNLFSQVGAQVAVIIVLLWLRRTVELKFPLRFLLIH